ncbi:hypothetical protein K435DRAFT_847482 [Dendrothele bispora CBS 962.96]|uniref:Uncharacterized protein n=1 Tax=Dendrothele bispora (strain CBS 962.96) TaxID=1314807 RepID=A0A4S8MYZ3_DENBC|nr:hypothetical protein K435DRAFT_847482 [Dendrothele bispora CBS 962.96]
MASTLKVASNLPKIDKTQFISSFIQSQKSHAKAYAEEGLSAFNSDLPEKENQFGFSSTPFLKPRNPKINVQENPASQLSKETKPSEEFKPAASTSRKISKKRSSTKAGSDCEEQAARMAERRERKRAKRMIVKPDTKESNVPPSGSKKGRSKNQRKENQSSRTNNKIPAALALIHGFSATNVGGQRLTVPSPVVGVFNKGKASTKIRVPDKKGSQKNNMQWFSEELFLNKASKEPDKAQKTRVDTSSDSESKSIPELPKKPKSKTEIKNKQESAAEPQESDSSTLESQRKDTSDTGLSQYDKGIAVESEVWNIERDSFVLPSHVSSVKCPSPNVEHRSVVLNTQDISWSKSLPLRAQEDDVNSDGFLHDTIPSDAQRCTKSSSSLAPSQSASQVGLSRHRNADTPPFLVSKYFVQNPNETLRIRERSVSPPGEDPQRDQSSLMRPSDAQQHFTRGNSFLPNDQPSGEVRVHLPRLSSEDHYLRSCKEQLETPLLSSPHQDRGVAICYEHVPGRGFFSPVQEISEDVVVETCLPQGTVIHNSAYVDCHSHTYKNSIPSSTSSGLEVDWPLYEQTGSDQTLFAATRSDYDQYLMPSDGYALSDVLIQDVDQAQDQQAYESDVYANTPEDATPVLSIVDVNAWQLDDVYMGCSNVPEEGYDCKNTDEEDPFLDQDVMDMPDGSYFEDMDLFSECAQNDTSDHECALSMSEVDNDNELDGRQGFLQGRELLLGLCGNGGRMHTHISSVEADVAKNMKGHWLPQRL